MENPRNENVELLREHARAIFNAGLKAVDPIKAIKRFVSLQGNTLCVAEYRYDLDTFERILVVGGGKAGASMAIAVEDILQGCITQGIVNVKYDHLLPTKTICLHEAGHPVPDAAGVEGTRCMTELLASATNKDLVLCLISGGGSALMPAPVQGISLAEKQAVTQQLLGCGATIHEINAIRKHISALKGGQLARIASPAILVTLVLSDVIGDPLDVIASGPTVPDGNTFADCLKILEKYALTNRIAPAVLNRIQRGVIGIIAETPKQGDPIFNTTQNLIIANNAQAAKAAALQAEALGYQPLILSTLIQGETREVAKVHCEILKEIVSSGQSLVAPACVISGGETTVTIRGEGLGGRNQEFALAAALEIENMENVLVFSAGTDGTDGPTDAAGAMADGQTLHRARDINMCASAYLKNNDAYHFFEPLGDLFKTGPTNTNVMDLRILLAQYE